MFLSVTACGVDSIDIGMIYLCSTLINTYIPHTDHAGNV